MLTQGWLSKYGPTIDGIPGRSFQEAADATFTVAGQLYGDNSDEQNAVSEGWKGVDITPRKVGKPSIEEASTSTAVPFDQLGSASAEA